MTALDIFRRKRMTAGRAILARCALAVAAAIAVAGLAFAQTQAVPGDVQVETKGGFVRIILHLREEVESDIRTAGGIVVAAFRRPIDVPIERLQAAVPTIIGAARRDPDGRGFRIALSRKATVNAMAAGERVFIDLLPETWKGVTPGLPREVIEELSRRARDAERSMRAQRELARVGETAARVRVATQPTFTRFVFELPDVIPVTSERGADDLTLNFGARIKFDFGEARAALPETVKAVESYEQGDTASVRFALNGKTDLRMFREDRNYVVDISPSHDKEAIAAPAAPSAPVDDPARFNAAGPALPERSVADAPQTVPVAMPAPAQARPENIAPVAAPSPQVSPSPPPAASPVSDPVTAKETAQPRPPAPQAARPAPVPRDEQRPATVVTETHAAERRSADLVKAGVVRKGDNLVLSFPFAEPTPAAIFRRAGTLWLVFDTAAEIDLSGFGANSAGFIRHVQGMNALNGRIVRLMLDRPRLIGAAMQDGVWNVTIGDNVQDPTQALSVVRSSSGASRPAISVQLDGRRELHRISDPDMGDGLLVVTALPPTRGFVRPLDFVEFRALASTHGVAIQPLADDVQVELTGDNVTVSRPGGLTLSGGLIAARGGAAYRQMIFNPELWGFDRQSKLTEREYKLIAAAADASEAERTLPRLDLARFYIAREMYAEAKGVLDVALAEDRPSADAPAGLVLHAITLIMLGRPDLALKELNDPILGDLHDAPLWRAVAQARLGQWEQSRAGFRQSESAIAMLPVELQRTALKDALRAHIEVGDHAGAQTLLGEFDTIGRPSEIAPGLAVLQGRLAQGLGKTADALRNYRIAADTADRPSAAQGQLRSLLLRYQTGEIERPAMIAELETLTTLWRGDETEIEALHILGKLYTEERRFRDAFYVMRSALRAHPNSDMTRRIQDEASVTFDSLFLAGKGDTLPAIDALSLFYDFRELTPIGRRGDEMIRRLADRLVSVDLLPQAAELLQHQVDNRLQGAARAHVATRLAVIYLMDRKPVKAQGVLRQTRIADVGTELRHLRLLLEARALSDTGRHDLALDVIGNIDNREAIRLRADILWSSRRFGEAAEQLELLHGERWRGFEPLSDIERADILRAGVGYALASDSIGLGRLKEKYSSKMEEGPDRRAFEIATAPQDAGSAEFRDLSKAVAAFDTLDSFLRDMRGRYPEIGTLSPGETQADIQNHTRMNADPLPTAAITMPARRAR